MDDVKVVKVIKKDKTSGSNLREDLGRDSIEQDGIIRGEVYSASAKARELLQKAQREAEAILRNAEEESAKQRQTGYDTGYQEGLAQTTELMVKARTEQEQFIKNANRDLMDLAFKIAEKIIGKQLEMEPETIIGIVKQAMQTVRQSKQLTIRVHPEDAKILKENEEELQETLGRQRILDVVEDKKVHRGGCIIESEIGTVEAQLQTQLERLKKILLQPKA
ncbi:type III secretion system stator protein SctL [bacterium]|nr:type III secretion system stator protein SctL [bacterium]MCI0606945.1 type III secretion system stator protein SctL [bacterium]